MPWRYFHTPPRSIVVNTKGRESSGPCPRSSRIMKPRDGPRGKPRDGVSRGFPWGNNRMTRAPLLNPRLIRSPPWFETSTGSCVSCLSMTGLPESLSCHRAGLSLAVTVPPVTVTMTECSSQPRVTSVVAGQGVVLVSAGYECRCLILEVSLTALIHSTQLGSREGPKSFEPSCREWGPPTS